MDTMEELIVNGFRFGSAADAATAREEEKKIQYIMERLNYDDPSSVLVIYNKMIVNRVFVTPIGNIFLNSVQKFLLSSDEIDPEEIVPIPLYTIYASSSDNTQPKERVRQRKVQTYKAQYNTAKAMIVVLLLVVVGMFFIAQTADNPNILNYKTALENKYAAWDQELTEREAVVREKERELLIESSDEKAE